MPAKIISPIMLTCLWMALFSCQSQNKSAPASEGRAGAAADQTDSFSPEDTLDAGSVDGKVPQQSLPAVKGTAMVYCAPKMIKDIPTILTAVVTKEELSRAVAEFSRTLHRSSPDMREQDITTGITADTLRLYRHMGVKLAFDPADFKQVTGVDLPVQDFTAKTALQWEWVLKPLRSTRKSILKFSFYCVDPDNNQESYILEKTISVSVRVDARSFLEKWGDFMVDDPKTTLTAILIPLVTFLGGFLSGKRKKKTN